MDQVSKSEYLRVRESGDMSEESLDIISRAGKYGIREDSEVEEQVVFDAETPTNQADSNNSYDEDDEIVDDLIGDIELRTVTVEAEQEAEIKRLTKALSDKESEYLERSKLKEEYNSSTEDGDANNVIDMINNIDPEDYNGGYALLKAQMDTVMKVLPEIAKNGNSNDPKVRKVLDMVEGLEQEKKAKESRRIAEERDTLMANDIEELWSSQKALNPGSSYQEANKEYYEFIGDITNKFNYTVEQTQLLLTKLANPKTKGKLAEALGTKGVHIPNSFDQMYQTITLLDFKNGVRVNQSTGVAEPILDAFGERQRLPSLNVAYQVKNGISIAAQQKQDALLEVSERSSNLDRGANIIPASRLDSISPNDIMDSAEIASILADVRRNPTKYQTDPDAMSRYQMVKSLLK